jgi:hypothetical protein
MQHRGAVLSTIELSAGRSAGFWLVVSALLLLAVLVPPLLLPLLLFVSLLPLAVWGRRPWITAPARLTQAAASPRSPRGPPRP